MKTMKKYCMLILLVLCISLTSCGKTIPVTISVTEETWADGGSVTSTTDTFEVTKGDDVDFDGKFNTPNGNFCFELIKVSEESVTIRTSEAMSLRTEEGGVNLNSEETDFIIEKGEEIILDTLTMDAGAAYAIEYK